MHLFQKELKNEYHSFFKIYSHYNIYLPIFRKTSYHTLSLISTSRLTIHQQMSSESMQQQKSIEIQGNRMEILIIHSEIKHKSKTMLGVV